MDEACAYIGRQMEQKKKPTFPMPKDTGQVSENEPKTTNTDVIQELLKETKQA